MRTTWEKVKPAAQIVLAMFGLVVALFLVASVGSPGFPGLR